MIDEPRLVAPRLNAAHALGTYVAIVIAQWVASSELLTLGTIVAHAMSVKLNDDAATRALTARVAPLIVVVGFALTILLTFASFRVFAWHLRRDRTSDGLGLLVPAPRELLAWSGVGALIGVVDVVAMRTIPAAMRLSEWTKLLSETSAGRWTSWTVAILSPCVMQFLFNGVMLRGLVNSFGAKIGSVVVVAVYVGGSALSVNGNWPSLVVSFLIVACGLWARWRTGSVLAAFALHQVAVLSAAAGYLAFVTPSP